MAPLRTFAALFLAANSASAFAPSTPAVKVSRPSTSVASSVFDDAVKDWSEEYPDFAAWGWGPSVQAEIWNGRHAMFGWVVMCACAYAKGHGLIPNADAALNLKEWGTLATISGKDTITNERAIILIANVHALFVGIAATVAPLPMSDTLFLDPNHPMYEWQVERNSKLGGVLPDLGRMGVTPHAELMNGRLAMMGIITCVAYSGIQGQSMIDTINEWVGGAYF
ncbi:hypothetical protein ACHAXH_009301 [Discostella pseudostelligera]